MASVDKILVGSPTYKQVIGNVTRVNKVVVGIPLSTVTIGPYADIDNIIGVDTSGKTDGAALVYDSDSGNFVANRDPILEVDGKTYPSDSAHTNILIRRSGTQGEPVVLQQGELAYSYLEDITLDGFGNGGDRLYIATGDNDGNGNSTQIDIIGGKYFTQFMQHPVGQLTANAALLTDADKSLNELLADSATFTFVRADRGFLKDITLDGSQGLQEGKIQASRGRLTDINGNHTYAQWGDVTDQFTAFGPSTLSPIVFTGLPEYNSTIGFTIEQENYSETQTPLRRPNGDLATLVVPNLLNVKGFTELDSTNIDGDLFVRKNLTVEGIRTSLDTKQVLVRDRQIVIGTTVTDIDDANKTGFVVGDSASPVARAHIRTDDTVDSDAWVFDPGIEAPFIKVQEFSFDVIDCGNYA